MKRFFIGMIFFSVVILFGTAGASDIGKIGLGQACAQGIASVLFLFTGMLGLKVCRMDEVRARRVRRFRKISSRPSVGRTNVFNEGRKMEKIA